MYVCAANRRQCVVVNVGIGNHVAVTVNRAIEVFNTLQACALHVQIGRQYVVTVRVRFKDGAQISRAGYVGGVQFHSCLYKVDRKGYFVVLFSSIAYEYERRFASSRHCKVVQGHRPVCAVDYAFVNNLLTILNDNLVALQVVIINFTKSQGSGFALLNFYAFKIYAKVNVNNVFSNNFFKSFTYREGLFRGRTVKQEGCYNREGGACRYSFFNGNFLTFNGNAFYCFLQAVYNVLCILIYRNANRSTCGNFRFYVGNRNVAGVEILSSISYYVAVANFPHNVAPFAYSVLRCVVSKQVCIRFVRAKLVSINACVVPTIAFKISGYADKVYALQYFRGNVATKNYVFEVGYVYCGIVNDRADNRVLCVVTASNQAPGFLIFRFTALHFLYLQVNVFNGTFTTINNGAAVGTDSGIQECNVLNRTAAKRNDKCIVVSAVCRGKTVNVIALAVEGALEAAALTSAPVFYDCACYHVARFRSFTVCVVALVNPNILVLIAKRPQIAVLLVGCPYLVIFDICAKHEVTVVCQALLLCDTKTCFYSVFCCNFLPCIKFFHRVNNHGVNVHAHRVNDKVGFNLQFFTQAKVFVLYGKAGLVVEGYNIAGQGAYACCLIENNYVAEVNLFYFTLFNACGNFKAGCRSYFKHIGIVNRFLTLYNGYGKLNGKRLFLIGSRTRQNSRTCLYSGKRTVYEGCVVIVKCPAYCYRFAGFSAVYCKVSIAEGYLVGVFVAKRQVYCVAVAYGNDILMRNTKRVGVFFYRNGNNFRCFVTTSYRINFKRYGAGLQSGEGCRLTVVRRCDFNDVFATFYKRPRILKVTFYGFAVVGNAYRNFFGGFTFEYGDVFQGNFNFVRDIRFGNGYGTSCAYVADGCGDYRFAKRQCANQTVFVNGSYCGVGRSPNGLFLRTLYCSRKLLASKTHNAFRFRKRNGNFFIFFAGVAVFNFTNTAVVVAFAGNIRRTACFAAQEITCGQRTNGKRCKQRQNESFHILLHTFFS